MPAPPIAKPKGRVTAQGVFAELGTVNTQLKNHQDIFAPKLEAQLRERASRIIQSRVKGIKNSHEVELAAAHAAHIGTEYVFSNAGRASESQFEQLVADALSVGIASAPQINASPETPLSGEEKINKEAEKQAKQIVEKNRQDLERTAVLKGAAKDLETLQGTSPQTQTIVTDEIKEFKEEPALDSSLTEDKLRGHVAGFMGSYKDEYTRQLPSVLQNPTVENLETARNQSYSLAQATLAKNTGPDSVGAARRVSLSLGLIKPQQIEHLEPYGLGRAQPNPLTFANAVGKESADVGIGLANRSGYQHKALLYLLATSPEFSQKEQELSENIDRLRREGKTVEVLSQQKLQRLLQKSKSETAKDPKNRQQFTKFFERTPGGRSQASRNAWRVVYTYFNQTPAFYVPQYTVTERVVASRAMGSYAHHLGDFSSSARPAVKIGGFVGGARGAFSAGKSALGLTKSAGAVAKVGTTAVKAASPVGLAMLAAQFASPLEKLFEMAKKGTAALIAYLIAMFGLKAIGLVVGLTFGAVTGLPLLLLGPPGWIAYAGWVGFWGYYGWSNPLGMLNIAFHPLAAVTNLFHSITGFVAKTFGAVGNAGSTIGSVFTGGTPAGAIVAPAAGTATGAAIGFVVGGPVGAVIGAGIGYLATGGFSQIKSLISLTTGASQATVGGLFGTAGSFLTGMGATVVNGLVGAAGSALGGAISFGSSFLSGLSGLVGTSASIGTLAAVPVFGGIGAIAIGGTIIGITTAASFFSPEGQGQNIPPGADNEFFTLEKVASSTRIENDELPKDITYTIKLTTKEYDLTNITITDGVQIIGEDPHSPPTLDTLNRNISPPCGGIEGGNLAKHSQWTCEFKITARTTWQNTNVINKVTVQANPPIPFASIIGSATAVTRIGTPPADCPQGWPLGTGNITQGPNGPTSHHNAYPAEQAIDIGGNDFGTETIATFTGTVLAKHTDDNNPYGVYVDIAGNCNGQSFSARWAHLTSIDPTIREGAQISIGQKIGRIDNTGTHTFGVHLHYSTFGLNIYDYIPTAPSRTDCDDDSAMGTAPCNVSW